MEEMRGYLIGWIHFAVPEALEYYQKLFPNKEMWITEWNIANPANRVQTRNSMRCTLAIFS